MSKNIQAKTHSEVFLSGLLFICLWLQLSPSITISWLLDFYKLSKTMFYYDLLSSFSFTNDRALR